MTILRPYQKVIYDEIPQRLKLGPVLVQAPARSGKSKIISETALRIIKAGKIPIVLTHRDKIKKQLVQHCSGESIDADTDHVFIQTGRCYVAMNQSLLKRPNILSQISSLGKQIVFLIDEAHRSDFNKTFDIAPESHKVGFTATPAWKWAKWLPERYKSLIHGPQVQELIESNNITKIDYYEMRNDLTGIKKGSNGEYTEESQFQVFDRAKLYDGLFDQLKKFQFKKCIVFCASKKAAVALDVQMKDHGYKSVCFYSGLPTYNLAKFTELDEANVLITVSALSEGFDHPPIDFNVLWRATSSLPLFIQMGMRGATPHPGKEKTTILDFGGNNSRFGGHKNIMAITMDRDWNALWQPPLEPPRLSNGVAAIKNCPACDYIISAMARSCSNCGYMFPDYEIKMKEGELVKIEHDLNAVKEQFNRVKGKPISQLLASELALFAKEKDKKNFAMRVAKAKEIDNPGFIVEYGKAMGYKPSWSNRVLQEIAEIKMYDPNFKIEYYDMVVK